MIASNVITSAARSRLDTVVRHARRQVRTKERNALPADQARTRHRGRSKRSGGGAEVLRGYPVSRDGLTGDASLTSPDQDRRSTRHDRTRNQDRHPGSWPDQAGIPAVGRLVLMRMVAGSAWLQLRFHAGNNWPPPPNWNSKRQEHQQDDGQPVCDRAVRQHMLYFATSPPGF